MIDDRPYLVLIACCKRKGAVEAQARYLYQGTLFKLSYRYAEHAVALHGGNIRILSALHGVLRPDQRIAPYEYSLYDMAKSQRQAWGQQVYDALAEQALLDDDPQIVVLAGKLYTASLTWLPDDTVYPLRGHGGIGQQIAWLKSITSP